jgi:hypothetical protein
VRLLAVLGVRDGMRFLPGFVANVGPQVDGIVALDDGSADGSAEYLGARPEVLEVIRVPASRPEWDEMGNHRALVQAALRHGADWVLALDADERLERHFRRRAEPLMRQGPGGAFTVRLLDLWDSSQQVRVDGIWGRKRVARLFRARADHVYDTAVLHGDKAPLQDRPYQAADLIVYHLGMLTGADRHARRRKYELADPEGRWQEIGYAYLTDEAGLRLRPLRARRGYRDDRSEAASA